MGRPLTVMGEKVRGTMATNRFVLRGYESNSLRDRSREEARPVVDYSSFWHDGRPARLASTFAQWQQRWYKRGYTPLVIYLAILTVVVFYLAVTQ